MDAGASVINDRLQRAALSKSGSQSADGCATLTKRRILVVEDAPDQQRFLASILQHAGAEVVLECNGLAAVEAVAKGNPQEQFDAILMDLQMPVMDGLSATRELRQSGFDQPIIAITAYPSEQLQRQWFEAGCDVFLEKPLLPASVVGAIAQRLSCLDS